MTLTRPGAHLHVHSAFSFLEGASLPRDLIRQAAAENITTVALTDTHRISGIVTFLNEAKQFGIRAIVGAEVEVEDLGRLVLLVPNTVGYSALVSLLSEAHLTSPRLNPRVSWDILERHGPGLVALTGDRRGILGQAWFKQQKTQMPVILERLAAIFGRSNLFIEMAANYLPGDGAFFHALTDLSAWKKIPTIATSAAHYAEKKDFGTFDLLTCIRLGQKIEEIDPSRHLNAENYIKPWSAMETALSRWPEALSNTLQLAERLETPNILNQRYAPRFALPSNVSAQEYLRTLVKKGAQWRYKDRLTKVWPRIEHELKIIEASGFTEYFLVVWDVTRFAREHRIRFAGRGSAADSVVAYCLGITEVDAFSRNLLFERFMSPERQEMPDIDIDFDARYRDQVIAYVHSRYGEEHVARVATYQTFRQRSALREVGKVLGFPIEELDRVAKSLPESSLSHIISHWNEIPELRQYPEHSKLQTLLQWAAKIEGLPRHIGTHLGGVVISDRPLSAISPREISQKGVQIIQFDKRDVETLGLLKLDLLGLRTFTAVDIATQTILHDTPDFSYDAIPLHDVKTYEQLQQGEGIGVFQLESPAQRSLALRLQPDRWEDIVASLALIRPGPIKGNMVDPFIARRQGRESVTYLHPALEPILSKTYGVVLFQEQVIAIASTLAGFTPGEADALRRVMTHARSVEDMQELGQKFKEKAQQRGVSIEVADAVFQQIVGYASYGFNEAHAAAFAETAYRTAYLLRHYPTEYFMGLLNAEPLGYYPIDVLLVEARRRGIKIYPIDINKSDVGVTKVGERALRIGLGFVKHLGLKLANHIVSNRPKEGFHSPRQLLDLGLTVTQATITIHIGAWDSLNVPRNFLIEDLMLPQGLYLRARYAQSGSPPSLTTQNAWDYQYCGFGQHQQWMAPWREYLRRQGFLSTSDIRQMKTGRFARCVGLLIRPHRPPTRSGKTVVFFSLLDETGVLEARLSPQGYQQFGHLLFGPTTSVIMVGGRVENRGMDVRTITPWAYQDIPH
ncbi:error-prone DNA polymerase [Sulfobacillus thermosulfidooxidans DSM 9293]|uniref:DNA-directed DNA polymerase n=1 Tax=Sulfobacillus thermosulfidooxidans (strain DSM 9293 / VKM B-1269 / AT-1) TaxID=929705 RepID=A0A1W1W7S1_SULTA|nr:DNA polymerase III subunit alpha [Sulfobacillus thermosulfidooxidans]SMC01803.1 error-prone DNA polymerase [Sulfobacillus thermosulfidooxidans DSM 9293]